MAVLGAVALVIALMHAMGLTKYVLFSARVMLGLTSSPDALPANWTAVNAEVVNIAHHSDEHYRKRATIVLRYHDASGRERVDAFDVYSPSNEIGRVRSGDLIEIEVCRQDSAIVKSNRFLLSERRKCVEEVTR